MDQFVITAISLVVMTASFVIGQALQPVLHERHRSQPSIESIRVMITLLVTFAAVVLGLMITSYQVRFANLETGLRGFSISMIELDRRMRDYGPQADPERADLITYGRSVVSDLWPEETPPAGDYPHFTVSQRSVESTRLGDLLNKLDLGLRRLVPSDPVQASLSADLRALMDRFLDERWALIANAKPSLSWPILFVVWFWLVVIFVISGIASSRNLVVNVVALLAALSLTSSIFLAIELDTPLTGYIKVSSAPLRDALSHITEAPLPPGVR